MKLYSVTLAHRPRGGGVTLLSRTADTEADSFIRSFCTTKNETTFSIQMRALNSSPYGRSTFQDGDVYVHVCVRDDDLAATAVSDALYQSDIAFTLLTSSMDDFVEKTNAWTLLTEQTCTYRGLSEFLRKYQETCDCGLPVTKSNRARHEATPKHRDSLKIQQLLDQSIRNRTGSGAGGGSGFNGSGMAPNGASGGVIPTGNAIAQGSGFNGSGGAPNGASGGVEDIAEKLVSDFLDITDEFFKFVHERKDGGLHVLICTTDKIDAPSLEIQVREEVISLGRIHTKEGNRPHEEMRNSMVTKARHNVLDSFDSILYVWETIVRCAALDSTLEAVPQA